MYGFLGSELMRRRVDEFFLKHKYIGNKFYEPFNSLEKN